MPVFHCELPFEFCFGLRLSMLKMLDNSACLPEAAWKSKFKSRSDPASQTCLSAFFSYTWPLSTRPWSTPAAPGRESCRLSKLLREGVARRGWARCWSWQLGQRPVGARVPSFLEASGPRGLAPGKFPRVGLDRGERQRGRASGEPAAPVRAGAPPPCCVHGLRGVERSDRLTLPQLEL